MPSITPFLWFTGDAEEAAEFYVSIFKNSKITDVSRYGEAGPGPAGSVMTVDFELDGQPLMAINAPAGDPGVPAENFSQGKVALFAGCKTQAEVDDLWDKLSEGGQKLPCGWVADRYGFAWNIVPEGLRDVIGGDDEERAARAMRAMLQMSKLDIDELRRVYNA
ncbi:MAG TPA: VOC family protein [Candidatus Cybelea sp.]|jgi:predicted 3-demethylubiquinone-9 3-methyltransferase (glyoxalase superfamily)|nr:VOC family protein [Candidatus Cybelea sp.]